LFVYDSDPTKEHFSGGANITKISLKGWQVSKKSYWDFLSIFSDDLFYFPNKFRSKLNFTLIFVDSDPTKKFEKIPKNFEKSESKFECDRF